MPNFLSKEDHSLIISGFCPCCHNSGFILGPAQREALAAPDRHKPAVVSQNILCPKCRREYNISRFASQVIEHVCPVERQRDAYNLVPIPIET